jgi:hypothetical protein
MLQRLSRRRVARLTADIDLLDQRLVEIVTADPTEAGKATAASPAGASNAREVALFRVAGITPVRQGTYIL